MKSLIVSLIVISVFLFVSSSAQFGPHGIVKRSAGEGEFFVFSNRTGCVSVVSNEPCQVTWKLAPYFAQYYDSANTVITASLKTLDLAGVSSECQNDLKAIQCSQVTPKCFEDGSKDYGEAKKTCEKIYNSCPEAIVDVYKKQRLCESLLTGKQPKSDCIFPPNNIAGVCPQPKHKMPSNILRTYSQNSQNLKATFEQLESSGKYSAECLVKYKDMSCNAAYCSEDKQRLLTKYDREDCLKFVKLCFDKVLGSLAADQAILAKQLQDTLNTTCYTYPTHASAQREPAPPTAKPTNGVSSFYLPKSLLYFFVFSLLAKFAFV